MLPVAQPDRPRSLLIERNARSIFGLPTFLLAIAVTLVGILLVRPSSTLNFAYYFAFWTLLILLLHRREYRWFMLGFAINSAFIAIFFLFQTSSFPDSAGMTSPFGSWTDDSFFFSLVADRIPAGIELRTDYDLYSEPFSTIVRALSPLPINHPLDVIFFQSGIAATLSTFLRRYVINISGDERLGRIAFVFAVTCPFLMMNGGVIFIRDTAAAALFIYALCCFNLRQWPLALGANVLELVIRPGTALILIPAYFILFLPDLRNFSGRRAALLLIGLPVMVFGGFAIGIAMLDLDKYQGAIDSVTLTGRQNLTDLLNDPQGNQIFLAIQQMPFAVRFVLNGAYMFLSPFLNLRLAFPPGGFDLRSLLMNLLIPIEDFWLNAWFIAGTLTKPRVAKGQVQIAVAVIVTFFILGTWSLQTRHKTMMYPLYYVIVAIGFARAGQKPLRVGYLISGLFLLLQIVSVLR